MKMYIDFFPWFWEEYLGDDGRGPFIFWTLLIVAIFLGISTYIWGWGVLINFGIGLLVTAIVVVIVAYILLIRDAWIDYQARLFDKLRGGPAPK